MSKPIVLIAEELSPAGIDLLSGDFDVREVDGADRAALLPALATADAVIIRGATKIDANTCTLEAGANGMTYPKQGIYRARSTQAQVLYYTGTRYGPTEASVALPPQ